jgi:outer membrane scaffolding protein for murein synthesis (MipA/OmpV family)
MSTRFLVLAALLFALPAMAATEETAANGVVAASPVPPDWTVTVGGGAVAVPSYPGASSTTLMPLPFIDVRYRDRFFLSPFAGIGVNAIATRRLQVGVAVLPDFGRSDSAADRLRGWGSVGAGANLKAFAVYSVGPFALMADARRQIGAGDGTLIDAGLSTTLPLARHLLLFPSAMVTWANARYSRTYFGIDANQSAASRALPTYAAGAGLRDAALSLMAVVPLDERWSVQSLVKAEILLSDAASSPLTERRIQPTFGGFVAYRL